MTVVRFDSALGAAQALVTAELAAWAHDIVLVRDIYGKVRVAIDDRRRAEKPPKDTLAELAARLDTALGAFSPGAPSMFLLASEMVAPEEIFAAEELSARAAPAGIRILDRQIVGSDWSRTPFADGAANRVALYGIKGGVGRSTAAAVLCWRLSRAGKRVLVLDLDLESPGLGTTLLPADREPDYGIVDWFVEDAVGQADRALVADMLARSPIGEGADVVVVPAGGRVRPGYSYLPKLARCYAEVPREDRTIEFGERLHGLVQELERQASPDVTILDSRAGLHDIAAVAVTRLNALSLLFAFDSPQNWSAYELLFKGWQADPMRTAKFRENLKMVAALVPETETAAYMQSFQENSYRLFEEYLYEETAPGEEAGFNFDVKNAEAPHSPLRVNWSRSIQQFDPIRRPGAVTDEQVSAAFGDFVREATRMILGEPVK